MNNHVRSAAWRQAKQLAELIGLRLFRSATLPPGLDFCHDVRRLMGGRNVERIFDVGANVGFISRQFRSAFPSARIDAFEPVASTFEQLDRWARTTHSVHAHHHALGNIASSVPLYHQARSGLNSLASAVNIAQGQARMEMVEIRKGDSIMQSLACPHLDLLKIDVEGFELEVLQGFEKAFSEAAISLVLIESCFVPSKSLVPLQVLREQMIRYGFSVFAIYDQFCDFQMRQPVFFNVLFCKPNQ